MYRMICFLFVCFALNVAPSRSEGDDVPAKSRNKPLAFAGANPNADIIEVADHDDELTVALKRRYGSAVKVTSDAIGLYLGGKFGELHRVYAAAERMIEAENELAPSQERRLGMLHEWLEEAIQLEKVVKDRYENGIVRKVECDLAAYAVANARVHLLKAGKNARGANN